MFLRENCPLCKGEKRWPRLGNRPLGHLPAIGFPNGVHGPQQLEKIFLTLKGSVPARQSAGGHRGGEWVKGKRGRRINFV